MFCHTMCKYILCSTYQCLNLELLRELLWAQSNDLKTAFQLQNYLTQPYQYQKVI